MTDILHRRLASPLASLLAVLALVLAFAVPAQAQLNLRIGGGSFQPMPIAVADFSGDPSLGLLVSSVVTNNLRRSGYFVPLEKGKFPENPGFDAVPGFDKWRAAGAQALITGRVGRDPSGKLKVEFRLWDVTSGQQLTGQQYGADVANARRTGHLISDVVYTKITGLGGWFDSRIAFVDESGSKENRRKRLMVMDQDGANVRALTNGESAVVAPRYSPSTQDIAFMTQSTGQQPRVQVINLETGARQAIGPDGFDEHQPALRAGRSPPRHERTAGAATPTSSRWISARRRRRRSPTATPSTPRRPIRRMGGRSASNRIAAARSRST